MPPFSPIFNLIHSPSQLQQFIFPAISPITFYVVAIVEYFPFIAESSVKLKTCSSFSYASMERLVTSSSYILSCSTNISLFNAALIQNQLSIYYFCVVIKNGKTLDTMRGNWGAGKIYLSPLPRSWITERKIYYVKLKRQSKHGNNNTSHLCHVQWIWTGAHKAEMFVLCGGRPFSVLLYCFSFPYDMSEKRFAIVWTLTAPLV